MAEAVPGAKHRSYCDWYGCCRQSCPRRGGGPMTRPPRCLARCSRWPALSVLSQALGWRATQRSSGRRYAHTCRRSGRSPRALAFWSICRQRCCWPHYRASESILESNPAHAAGSSDEVEDEVAETQEMALTSWCIEGAMRMKQGAHGCSRHTVYASTSSQQTTPNHSSTHGSPTSQPPSGDPKPPRIQPEGVPESVSAQGGEMARGDGG